MPIAPRVGRPPFDHVLMFKVQIRQVMHSLSDERGEYLIKGRLSADAVPDADTIWTFREALKKANAADVLFEQFDAARSAARGRLSRDVGPDRHATIVAAPKQRNTTSEKQAIKESRISIGLE